MFVGAILIGMVAPFARFKANKFMRYGHMFFAIGGFTLLSLSFYLDGLMPMLTKYFIALPLLVYIFTKNDKNVVWNVEIAFIYYLMFSCIMVVLNAG